MAETTSHATSGDDRAKELAAQLAVLEARAKLTTARTAALSALAPGVANGPTGEVTVGEKAGGLGPWLAHQVVAEIAGGIAAAASAATKSQGTPWHVLVTTDANLLTTDVQATLILASLTERSKDQARVTDAVRAATTALREAVDRYAAHEEQLRSRENDVSDSGGRARLNPDTGEAPAPAGTGEAPAPAGSALGAAVELVQLTATDFSVSAVDVSADAALLATLTAGAVGSLAGARNRATLDGFDVAHLAGPTVAALHRLAAAVAVLAEETLVLSQLVAPVAAELGDRRGAVTAAQSAWADAVGGKEATADRIQLLREHLDRLTADVARRQAAVAPAQAVLAVATARVDAARAEMVAVTTVDSTGVSPLARACAREALHSQEGRPVTHVLHVRPTQVGAEMVTRRSVLGSSGRVFYLGTASAAWALLDVRDGTLVGGAQHRAKQKVHDLATGKVWAPEGEGVQPQGAPEEVDPLAATEAWVRVAVLALAFGVAVLGIVAALGLAFS
ncbi:MAG: hypothetical protein IR158_08475 [Cellulomonas sp.]|uniref:hypothetical protein n=1 Tax=Cellulomonas sp. TaxID=40001 RepID=UPI0019ED54FE|nr:hypothetical protein [Cellulomonas sp.]MBF0687782.1 hypothetical protein [Cellulomonas sp.]